MIKLHVCLYRERLRCGLWTDQGFLFCFLVPVFLAVARRVGRARDCDLLTYVWSFFSFCRGWFLSSCLACTLGIRPEHAGVSLSSFLCASCGVRYEYYQYIYYNTMILVLLYCLTIVHSVRCFETSCVQRGRPSS